MLCDKVINNADFSDLFKTMIDDTSNQMVSDAMTVMHENSLFLRNEESELDNKERDKSIQKYTALKYIHTRGVQQFLEIITLMKSGFADGA